MVSKLLKKHLNIFFLLCFTMAANTYGQDLLDDAAAEFSIGDNIAQFTETIKIISRSGKIFILTNSNQLLSKGDFITISLKDDGPVARAIVAKNHKGRAGIKVVKVYSLQRWGKLRRELDVDVLRGDDTGLFSKHKKKKETVVEEADTRIVDEEDLFNDKEIIEEDLAGFYNDKRHIKPDNIVSVGYAQFSFVDDVTGDKLVNNQFNYAWAYQFADNYWVEGIYGRVDVRGFPREGEQTIINNFVGRIKYTFKAPLYSFIIPYIGFQTYSVSSPNAGKPVDNTTDEIARAELEADIIDELEKTQLVVGFTFLRRLVPGWFFKADVGNDILSAGFAIEF